MSAIFRGCGIALLFLVGLFFIPGACATPFIAAEVARSLTGDDQWALAAMGGSFLISITLLMIGESLGG